MKTYVDCCFRHIESIKTYVDCCCRPFKSMENNGDFPYHACTLTFNFVTVLVSLLAGWELRLIFRFLDVHLP